MCDTYLLPGPHDLFQLLLNANRDILVTAASKLPQCDWGLVRRARLSIPSGVIGRATDLSSFLTAQAKVSACDGQYRAALEHALTLRRIARHFGDDTAHMYMQAQRVNYAAFDVISYVLGKMPPDAETLTWLEKELAAGGEMEWRPSRETLAKWIDWEVQCLQASPDVVHGAMKSVDLRKKTEGLTEAQVLERARQGWEEVFKSVLDVLESEMSPQDKSRALGRLSLKAGIKISGTEAFPQEFWESDEAPSEEKARELKQLLLAAQDNRDPMMLMGDLIGAVDSYSSYAYRRARVRAVQVAIAVYFIKAKTGQLPQTLPTDLPKDPYTGKDFEYEVIENGFVLRCRGTFASEQSAVPRQFEFRVK